MNTPLVIFDCDGVLVDSEPISTAMLMEVLATRGVAIDAPTIYDRFLGRSLKSTAEVLTRDYGVEAALDLLLDGRAGLHDRFRRDLGAIPGVREAVTALEGPYCVASSSLPERIRLSLSITGLLDLFTPRIYSASMVEHGKPAPDLFLHAAADMGFAPADCIVVEDSPAGIEAAHRAGMRVIAFTGGGHAGFARLAERTAPLNPHASINRMTDLPETIRALCPRT